MTLTEAELAELPLTDHDLTERERTNLAVVLHAYDVAEGDDMDVQAFVDGFAEDGVFNDVVAGHTYRSETLGAVLPRMKGLFSDVHRELQRITVSGDVVSIELSIRGTFDGELTAPTGGVVKGNGNKVDVPTADFWYLRDGKVEKFDCYVGYTKMYADMGVDLDWASAVDAA
ncbi:nuclear transport factor 2 family protein [Streptomyces griseoaurantiacus]|uniref:nuclear transport factor 2 family protein n=1 Tax=Streptomyces griseoaurantiacus TaxID=68213 RepID=UPI00369161B8